MCFNCDWRGNITRNAKLIPHGHAYLDIFQIYISKLLSGEKIVSELKCCKRCGAFLTCDHKGECCVECEHFDPMDILCMAGPEVKAAAPVESLAVDDEEVDPATFLFEDDDEEEEDLSDLPPERDADKDKFNPADEDAW